MSSIKEWTLDAALESLRIVTEQIDQELEKLDCPIKTQFQIDVAVDELFSNIANYAYGSESGKAVVRFAFDESDRMVSLTFIDHGIAYDPLKKDDPDVTLSAEEREIGGLGIFLVKKTMDEMDYRYEDGCNILTIRKRI